MKHANSILESFKYFCQISSTSIHITRDSIYAIARTYMLSPVRLSFRPSVRRVYHTKTIEDRIMKFSPYGSPSPLIFRQQVSSGNSEGFPQSGSVKWGWGR